MLCKICNSILRKNGFNSNKIQKYKCVYCRKIYLAPQEKLFDEMRIAPKRGISVLYSLLEGLSIRSTERITNIHRDTILDLLVKAGNKCARLLENKIQKVPVDQVQADEIWGFVYCKQKTKKLVYPSFDDFGDAYTFVALERETKLILTWHLGKRTKEDTEIFINKLDKATYGKFQITTDGFESYPDAISSILGTRVSFAQVIKEIKYQKNPDHKYSPSKVLKLTFRSRFGDPDRDYISTSHVERHNLTMRMSIRRLTRLTNAFSKKLENLRAALALYFAYYNFCRIHSTIKTTPAIAAGITNHVWTIKELLLE